MVNSPFSLGLYVVEFVYRAWGKSGSNAGAVFGGCGAGSGALICVEVGFGRVLAALVVLQVNLSSLQILG